MILGQVILLTGMILSLVSQPEWGYFYCRWFSNDDYWIRARLASCSADGSGSRRGQPELSGAASGLTNMMHQLGGPVGLSIVVLFSSNIVDLSAYYHLVMGFITAFSISRPSCLNFY